MLELLLNRSTSPLHVLFLGAHCDDIEIGCGGTLQQLRDSDLDFKITCAVFSSNSERERETRQALERLAGTSGADVQCFDFRNGFFPHCFAELKEQFEQLKALEPDLIFTHSRDDRHQDHKVVSDLTWNTFRDHMVLEYEIPKYDGDLGQPSFFIPLTPTQVTEKVSTLLTCFSSESNKDWFSEDTFTALMRLRGVESRASSGFAEAFFVRKAKLSI